MEQLLIIPSSDGTLVFGMDWLPLIGRRTDRTAYRAARQYKATHLVFDGPQAAAVGLATVPFVHTRNGQMLDSAARSLAALFPSGTVAMLLPLKPDVFWIAGIHEGTVVAGTDRLYRTPDQANAGLDGLKQAFPHLVVLGDENAPPVPPLEAIRAAASTQSKLLKSRARRRRLPVAIQWIVLLLTLVLLIPRLWRLLSTPKSGNAPLSVRHDSAALWRKATARARRQHVIHGVSGTRLVLDAFYQLPVNNGGWNLKGAYCLASASKWNCVATYHRAASGASNDSFLQKAPGYWKVDFPSMDQARPSWTFASAGQRLDRLTPRDSRYNDRHLLSRFQAVSSAFTRLTLDKATLFPVTPPDNGRGEPVTRPKHYTRYFTRVFRAEGPLRSASLLLPYLSFIEWKKISIAIADTRDVGLKASRVMVVFEGVLHESESLSKDERARLSKTVLAQPMGMPSGPGSG